MVQQRRYGEMEQQSESTTEWSSNMNMVKRKQQSKATVEWCSNPDMVK